MKAFTLIIAYFCVNAGIWTINMISLLGVLPNITNQQPIVDPTNIANMFSFNVFSAVTGIVGGITIGILAMVTRSYLLSGGVLVLWVVGVIFKPIQDIFVGLPNLIMALLPPEIWFVSEIFVAFSAIVIFAFFAELLTGKDITGGH